MKSLSFWVREDTLNNMGFSPILWKRKKVLKGQTILHVKGFYIFFCFPILFMFSRLRLQKNWIILLQSWILFKTHQSQRDLSKYLFGSWTRPVLLLNISISCQIAFFLRSQTNCCRYHFSKHVQIREIYWAKEKDLLRRPNYFVMK